MAAAEHRLAARSQLRGHHLLGLLVGAHHVVPHAQGHEDVRGHVLRMRRGGRDRRQAAGGLQRACRMLGIVHAVDPVVRRARVLGVAQVHRLRDARGLEEVGQVALAMREPEQRQGMEQPGFVVAGKASRQVGHRLEVARIARTLLALAVEHFGGGQPGLLAFGRCAGGASGGVRRQLRERRAPGGDVLLVPDRVRVGHRLAPVGEREAGIARLCVQEGFLRRRILEQVQQQHAAHEGGLRGGIPRGGREVEPPQRLDALARFGCRMRLRAVGLGRRHGKAKRYGEEGRGEAERTGRMGAHRGLRTRAGTALSRAAAADASGPRIARRTLRARQRPGCAPVPWPGRAPGRPRRACPPPPIPSHPAPPRRRRCRGTAPRPPPTRSSRIACGCPRR